MKRVRIMLMAVLALAIVGGALAFKSQSGDVPFCLATPFESPAGLTCEDPEQEGVIKICNEAAIAPTTTTLTIVPFKCYVETLETADCNDLTVECPNLQRVVTEE